MKAHFLLLIALVVLDRVVWADEEDFMRFDSKSGDAASLTLAPSTNRKETGNLDSILNAIERRTENDGRDTPHPDDIYVYQPGKKRRSVVEEIPSWGIQLPDRYYGPAQTPVRESYTEPQMLTAPPPFFPDTTQMGSFTGLTGWD